MVPEAVYQTLTLGLHAVSCYRALVSDSRSNRKIHKAKGETMTDTKTMMTAGELTAHLREIMRTDIGAHLREVHGVATPPKAKSAQHTLHQKLHAEAQPAPDAATAKDTSVIAGVTRKPEPKAEPAKPATRTRKAPATKTAPKPATRTKPAAKASPKPTTRTKPATADPKANGKAPEPKAEANGTSPRETNQALARRLVELAAKEFASSSVEDQTKVANWLKTLPTGGAGWQRYWPESFARPTTADWRKP